VNYKKVTKEQELEILSAKIADLERQHKVASIELIAAKAVADATDDDSTQHDTSEREVEQLERNVHSMEAAIEALHTELTEKFTNRASRRADAKKGS